MSRTSKVPSDQDANQTLQGAYNDVDSSFTTNGFLVGKVGHRVSVAIAGAVETYTFSDNGTQLYQLELVYTDGTRSQLLTATRIS